MLILENTARNSHPIFKINDDLKGINTGAFFIDFSLSRRIFLILALI